MITVTWIFKLNQMSRKREIVVFVFQYAFSHWSLNIEKSISIPVLQSACLPDNDCQLRIISHIHIEWKSKAKKKIHSYLRLSFEHVRIIRHNQKQYEKFTFFPSNKHRFIKLLFSMISMCTCQHWIHVMNK